MKCQSINKNCKQCGWKQDHARVETCAQCGADMRCGKSAVEGYTLCIQHGGPVPSRNFYGKGSMSTGSGSSFPLTRLAAAYNRQVNNGVVLSNRAAVDIIDIRIRQLLERVDVKEAPNRVSKLYELWMELKETVAGSTERMLAEKALDEAFERVYHDYKAWEQIFDALDLRGKTTEREIKALREIKAIMTAEDGYQLAAKMMAAVIRVIGDDPKKIKQVQYEFSRIIGESSDLAHEGYGEDAGGSGETIGGEARSGDVDQEELLYSRDEE